MSDEHDEGTTEDEGTTKTEETDGGTIATEGSGTDQGDGADEGDGEESEGKGDKDGGSDEGAPEEYTDFSVPDGFEISETDMNESTALFKDAKLTQEQAQKFIDFEVARNERLAAEAESMRTETRDNWRKAVEQDEDLGGANLAKTKAQCGQVLRTFDADGSFTELLEHTDLGNHPLVVGFLTSVGKSLAEDSGSGGDRGGEDRDTDRLSKMYPSMSD
jgi:hypothetical protein